MRKRWKLRWKTILGILGIGSPAFANGIPGRPLDASKDFGVLSDYLFNFTTIAITILFIIMCAGLFYACIVHADRKGRKAVFEHGVGPRHLALIGVTAGVIFFGVDGPLLYYSFVDLTEYFWKFPTQAQDPVQVEVLAQQWGWNFRYSGKDNKFNTADDIVTWQEMHVPVGRPVYVKMKSKDVIHSFYLPNFRTKQDAFPGTVSQLWFQATKVGTFDIGCAQHCGSNHYKMHGTLVVSPADEYAAWLKDAEGDAQRKFNKDDPGALWGWDWEM